MSQQADSQQIILTRPLLQAQSLAQRLTMLGYSVELFPLLEIAPLAADSASYRHLQTTLTHLSRYALAVFVSPNAIHAVFQNQLVWPSEVAIAVMGEGSRAALAQYGINETNTRIYCPTDPFHSDSETLLQELDLSALEGREVLIFRAETGRELLAEAFNAHGIHVIKAVCYRRYAPSLTAEQSQRLLQLIAPNHVWVLSSSEGLRTLVEMIKASVGPAYPGTLQHMNIWVSHHRIAETAEKCGFKRIHLIGSGDENLVHALQSPSGISLRKTE